MKDQALVYVENADISGTVTSDVLKFADATDSAKTGALHRYSDGINNAAHLIVHVHTDIEGTEAMLLEHSDDGSTFTTAATVVLTGKEAGDVVSVATPANLKNYSRIAKGSGTAGTYSAYLGFKEMETL